VVRERERDASACIRRHQAFALAPVVSHAPTLLECLLSMTLLLGQEDEGQRPCGAGRGDESAAAGSGGQALTVCPYCASPPLRPVIVHSVWSSHLTRHHSIWSSHQLHLWFGHYKEGAGLFVAPLDKSKLNKARPGIRCPPRHPTQPVRGRHVIDTHSERSSLESNGIL